MSFASKTALIFLILSWIFLCSGTPRVSAASGFPADSLQAACIHPPLQAIYGEDFRKYLDSLKFIRIEPDFFKKHFSGSMICGPASGKLSFFNENPVWLLGDCRSFENKMIFMLVNLDSWGWGYHYYYIVYDKTADKMISVINAGFTGEVGDFASSADLQWLSNTVLMVHINSKDLQTTAQHNTVIKYDTLTVQYKYSDGNFSGRVLEKKTITDTTAGVGR
jgi:hypothetical protein